MAFFSKEKLLMSSSATLKAVDMGYSVSSACMMNNAVTENAVKIFWFETFNYKHKNCNLRLLINVTHLVHNNRFYISNITFRVYQT